MCDTGPDVRSGELSEGFVTSPRARTSRGRAEHAVRVPSCVRARLEIRVHITPSYRAYKGHHGKSAVQLRSAHIRAPQNRSELKNPG